MKRDDDNRLYYVGVAAAGKRDMKKADGYFVVIYR